MTNPQELLLAIAWVRKNLKDGEDPVILLAKKLLNSRVEEGLSKMDYWEGQVTSSEKALTRLEKMEVVA